MKQSYDVTRLLLHVGLTVFVIALVGGLSFIPASNITQPVYSLVQDEGGALVRRPTINCVGAGITCADDAGGNRTTLTVAGSSSLSGFIPIPVATCLVGGVTAIPGAGVQRLTNFAGGGPSTTCANPATYADWAEFASTGSAIGLEFHPGQLSNWDGGQVDISINWMSDDGNAAHVVRWMIGGGCLAAGGAAKAVNATQNFDRNPLGAALRFITSTFTNITTTGCAATDFWLFQLSRASGGADTATGIQYVFGATIKYSRTP